MTGMDRRSLMTAAGARAQPVPVLFDTDIGTDIDDAYALALILRSPEIELLGVTTVSSDAVARARLAASTACAMPLVFAATAAHAADLDQTQSEFTVTSTKTILAAREQSPAVRHLIV